MSEKMDNKSVVYVQYSSAVKYQFDNILFMVL